ncbi:MAG: hypothetical protein NFCOHLIN_02794 [Gammaproteobacteria bacterium]|nr:hypothetical protein [Gammaproteobacteria bacterium]
MNAANASTAQTIVLATLNARYIHASLGLRYLLANMGDLGARTVLREYVIGQRPIDIVEDLLAGRPRILGLGVYVWNVEEAAKVAALVKEIAPEVVMVLGGPEVSHELDASPIAALADYVVTGWGDASFPRLCRSLLQGERPPARVIAGEQPPLHAIALPYRHYTDADIAHRLLYVEASRGCPFKCEFCLSALDRTAWPFDLERFLAEMQSLYERGARHFKFVDRTFNLSVRTSLRILEFFLARMDDRLFLHFELVPDHLPEALKSAIADFPPGSLQFEIGIQTLNPEVQALISRRQDNDQALGNLCWLREHTHAHIHADLIAGLPGEDLASFARGFDLLCAQRPHEIQVGILKRLRGAPIARHTEASGMRYNPHPPYNVLATDRIDFATMQRLGRFARYWDLIGNSGRFVHSMADLLGDEPFARFMRLTDWLYARTGQTHQFAVDRLFDLVAAFLTEELRLPEAEALAPLARDYLASGQRGSPAFLARAPGPCAPPRHTPRRAGSARQDRHHRQ